MNRETFISLIKNRYFYTLFIFLIWLGFIDHNNLIQRVKLKQENVKLQKIKQSYIDDIKKTEEEMKALEDKEYLEKLAREKYLMKKKNEDIFIVTE